MAAGASAVSGASVGRRWLLIWNMSPFRFGPLCLRHTTLMDDDGFKKAIIWLKKALVQLKCESSHVSMGGWVLIIHISQGQGGHRILATRGTPNPVRAGWSCQNNKQFQPCHSTLPSALTDLDQSPIKIKVYTQTIYDQNRTQKGQKARRNKEVLNLFLTTGPGTCHLRCGGHFR